MICSKFMNDGQQLSNVQLVIGEQQLKLQDEDWLLELASENASKEPHGDLHYSIFADSIGCHKGSIISCYQHTKHGQDSVAKGPLS